MALLCVSAYISILLLAVSGPSPAVWVTLLTGVSLAFWSLIRAKPKAGQFRWIETVKTISGPALLWLAIEATEAVVSAYAKWVLL
jgi:hypothetical protein